jgi:Ala-tRNA(Pro) deacylase
VPGADIVRNEDLAMMKSKENLFEYLRDLKIETHTYDYEPVPAADQTGKIGGGIPGCDCKNLFLKDNRRLFWLVVAKFTTQVDLKKLAKHLSVGSLSFANEKDLMRFLGVTPGGVTPFGLIHDVEHVVHVVIEESLFDCEQLTFHPLTNTALTAISSLDFKRFLSSRGNKVVTFRTR